jgi:hypothetical protein
MDEENIYLNYLISDLENYVFLHRKKANNLLSGESLGKEDSLYILEKINKTLVKVENLLKILKDVHDVHLKRHICIISSESLSWKLFTLPNIEQQLPLFSENMRIKGTHIMDMLGEYILLLEEIIEQPKIPLYQYQILSKKINDISMALGYIYNMSKRSEEEN